MKNGMMIGLFFISLTLSLSAQALEVHSAGHNRQTNELSIEISYGGGCREHEFILEVDSHCQAGTPVIQKARVKDLTTEEDPCSAIVTEDLQFSLDDYPLCQGPMVLSVSADTHNKVNVALPESDRP